MMSDPGKVLFTLIPHSIPRGSVGFPMKLTRICLVSLGCVAGAFSFGVIANAALDLVMPTNGASNAIAVSNAAAPLPAQAAEQPAQPASFALASAESTPVELGPSRVKTVPIVMRDGEFAQAAREPIAQINTQATQVAPQVVAQVPLPRPRPAGAPTRDGFSVASQPGSLAIAAATHKVNAEDGEMLSAAGIDRMKLALALTTEQEEYWPAIAAELRALGKALKGKGEKHVDNDTMQRLYWAAAPLISRLSYEQKMKVKQMARLMGLNQVAEAL
jgi:hypothetical protein